jgi:NaMN:DMB phosphoribosyltransferase
VNFLLAQISGGSSKLILESAAKAMGTTPEKVRQMAITEADEVLSQSGGCKSKTLQTVIQEGIEKFGKHQKYLADVADLIRQNPGRKVFR